MKLTWDEAGTRQYETGISMAVLYPPTGDGVAWNGMIAVNFNPEGGETSPIYANNVKIAETVSIQDFSGDIEVFTVPKEFAPCEGSRVPVRGVFVSMQKKLRFGLSYRTKLGDDIHGEDYAYKLHIHYGCLVQSQSEIYATMNEQPEIIHHKFKFTSLPVKSQNMPPLTYICLDSSVIPAEKFNVLNTILYGTEVSEPRLPSPDEIAAILTS